MKRFLRLPTRWALSAIFFASVLTTVSVPSAAAHDLDVGGPIACGPVSLKQCGYGGVRAQHTWVYACDTQADGDGFRVDWVTRSGKSGSVGDSNGSKAGCGGRFVTSAADPVVTLTACNASLSVCALPGKA